MKKNIGYYVLCLFLPFFIFTSEGHASSFLGFFKDSKELKADISKLEIQKKDLKAKEAKLIQKNATGGGSNELIEELEATRKKLTNIEKKITSTKEKLVKTEAKEAAKREKELAKSRKETQEALAEANKNLEELEPQQAALKELKKQEKGAFLAMNDCVEVGDCDEVKADLKEIQTQIKKTETNIAKLEKKLAKANGNIEVNNLLTDTEKKELYGRINEAKVLVISFEKEADTLLMTKEISDELAQKVNTLLNNSPSKKIEDSKTSNEGTLGNKIKQETSKATINHLTQLKTEMTDDFNSFLKRSTSMETNLENFLQNRITPCLDAKSANDEEKIKSICFQEEAALEDPEESVVEAEGAEPQGTASPVAEDTNTENTTTTSTTSAPRAITSPIFNGPGLVAGANITEAALDNNISKERNMKSLIIGWTKFLYPIAALLAVVALVWAGFLYITALGDDGKIDSAKKIVIWTIVGILCILGAYAIVNTVMQAAF